MYIYIFVSLQHIRYNKYASVALGHVKITRELSDEKAFPENQLIICQTLHNALVITLNTNIINIGAIMIGAINETISFQRNATSGINTG